MNGLWLRMRKKLRRFYVKHLRGRLSPIGQQRLKLVVWDVWGYHVLLRSVAWTRREKLWLLPRFLKIDWNVEHAHKPAEVAFVIDALGTSERGCLVEAGCWKGGASAKFSLACARRGRDFHVFDSFQGVQEHTFQQGEYNFAGEYASPIEVLTETLVSFGTIESTTIHPGWFADSMIEDDMPNEIAVVYIDCDVVDGTFDVLRSTVPRLTRPSFVFTQDYGIAEVRKAIDDPERWAREGLAPPSAIRQLVHYTAELVIG